MFLGLPDPDPYQNVMDPQDWFLSCVLSLCQCLEGLKAHAKLLSLGESMDSSLNIQSDKVELCRYRIQQRFYIYK